MDCSSIILSEDTYEFIVERDEMKGALLQPECRQPLNENYEIWYYDRKNLPPLSVATYSYGSIPKCLGLISSTSLENTGIIKVQNQPTLFLRGQGVFVAVIDTGINMADDAFRNPDGSTRVFSVWDQTAGGRVPAGFSYGREYTREEINEALFSENPEESMLSLDSNGHGTFLASVACGSPDVRQDFVGVAPDAELLVVKVKPAKKYLRDFFFVPGEADCYAESDIMTAVAYVQQVAQQQGRPLVIFLGMGCNNGNHAGSCRLCQMLGTTANKQDQIVVTATGNEANNRHHFFGVSKNLLSPLKVEVNVEEDMSGFYAEFWAFAPQIFAISVQSPTGEIWPRNVPVASGSQSYKFIFEGTMMTIDYRDIGGTQENQLIFLRLQNVPRGIWTIQVYPINVFEGDFNLWLPMKGLLESDVFFLQPTPETTLTMPSDSPLPISVGGYNGVNGALYLESGRGFAADGWIKPDFLAPAVEIQGKGLRNNYVTFTGTSAASAITAGVCAQAMEWAVVQNGYAPVNTVNIKNFLIRGCRRNPDQNYPSPVYGYGLLDIYQAFEVLRR